MRVINVAGTTSVVMAARTGNTRYSGLGIGIPENQWCCIGVLCDILVKLGKVEWREPAFNEGEYLAFVPSKYAHPVTYSGTLPATESFSFGREGEGPDTQQHLIVLNDRDRKSFTDIATWIEEKL